MSDEPEPVAYMDSEGHLYNSTTHPERYTPLYTATSKKEWVGLTQEEHMKLAEEWGCLSADWVFYAAAVERKLKEKNT
jgi:hypothetical protein